MTPLQTQVRHWLSKRIQTALDAGATTLDPDEVLAECINAHGLQTVATNRGHWIWLELRAAFMMFAESQAAAALVIADAIIDQVNPDDIPFSVMCPHCRTLNIAEAFNAFSRSSWGRHVIDGNRQPFYLNTGTFARRIPIVTIECMRCKGHIKLGLAVFAEDIDAVTQAGDIEVGGTVPVRQPQEEPPNMLEARRTKTPDDARAKEAPDLPDKEPTDGDA